MKTLAIIQARSNSKRFPNKVLKKINGLTIIEILLKRLSKSKKIDQLVVATTKRKSDNKLYNLVKKLGYHCFRGSERNVLLRFINAADTHSGKIIVRVTGDCPLIDPKLVDRCINNFKKDNLDYYTNTNPPTFPDGLDVEVTKIDVLKKINLLRLSKSEREHVTKYLRKNNRFKIKNLYNKPDLSKLRWTLDEEKDLHLIKKIFNSFKPDIHFGWKKVLLMKNKKVFNYNIKTQRNEGSEILEGKKLWTRANNIIPGGNMLLSKKPEIYHPEKWPAYFKKAKGCEIVDYDNRKFYDFSSMGVGTNILGYGRKEIDDEVVKNLRKGNMSTLNCPEEVGLAERLLELHPWADMVKFARTGGEANAIAIRIARAASNKDKIAICGYHGWHDWYLSANLKQNKNLDSHLIPGLNIKGVPKNLRDTVFTFNYNDLSTLKRICASKKIGVIKMEVIRNIYPTNNFLKKVRKLCNEKKIILIFDECTTGFRETFGGIHKKFKVSPDISIFGKALGNGYAITAVIGKKNIMKFANKSFISSTFWTERIGPTAALKTLEIMEKEKSWEKITNIGLNLRDQWKIIANKYNLDIQISGIPSLSSFSFLSKNNEKYKILIAQEMIKKNFLASNSIYISTEHKEHLVKEYLYNLEKVFKLIKECEDGRNINELIKKTKINLGFGRLN